MKHLRKLVTLLAFSLSLAMATPEVLLLSTPTATVEAANVRISKTNATLTKGRTIFLRVIGTKKKPKWSSSNERVAAVTPNGKVKTKAKGTATIKAKVGKKSFKCKVTVETPTISKKSCTLEQGATVQLKMNGTKRKIGWRSSNSSIAAVSKGNVSAKSPGICYIYGTVGGKDYSCKITVKTPPQPQPEPQPDITYVWLSATGTKYHKIPNCGRMNPNTARQVTIEEAIASGFGPCEKCF